MVAMTPLITIQLLGIVSKFKEHRKQKLAETVPVTDVLVMLDDDAIIEL